MTREREREKEKPDIRGISRFHREYRDESRESREDGFPVPRAVDGYREGDEDFGFSEFARLDERFRSKVSLQALR